MRDAANAVASRLKEMRELLNAISRIDPKAAKTLETAYRPVMETGASRLDLARKVEEVIVEIAQTRNYNRLAGTPLRQSRDAAGLVSNQLRQMNMSLIPQGIAQTTNLLERIKQLPTTLNEAKDSVVRLTAMVASSAAGMARAAGPAASRAITAALEALIALGSRMVFVPLLLNPEVLRGNDKET
jgi:hypothetical protein